MGATAPVDYAGVEGQKQAQQSVGPVAATQSHGPAQDANPLNRLTEEQREEINEAVRITLKPTQDSDSRSGAISPSCNGPGEGGYENHLSHTPPPLKQIQENDN